MSDLLFGLFVLAFLGLLFALAGPLGVALAEAWRRFLEVLSTDRDGDLDPLLHDDADAVRGWAPPPHRRRRG